MEKYKKITMCLLKLWIICFLAFSIGSSIYISYQQVIVGSDPTIFVSELHLFTLGIVLLYFIPLLFTVRYFSKKSGSDELQKVVAVILIWLVVSASLLLFSIVFFYVAPETFATITSFFG